MKQLLSKIAGRWGRRASLITAGALAGALVLLLCVTQPPLLRQVDLKLYDHFLVRAAGGKHPGLAAVVDVDEASMSACGQWPWPRYRLAMLVDRLLEAGAVSVVLDIMLAEPDRTSVDAVLRDLDGTLGVKARVEDLPESFRDNDRLLAETLRGKPVVLGAYLTFTDARGQSGNSAPSGTGTAEPDTIGPGGAKPLPQGLNVIERARPGAVPVRERLAGAVGMLTPVSIFANRFQNKEKVCLCKKEQIA